MIYFPNNNSTRPIRCSLFNILQSKVKFCSRVLSIQGVTVYNLIALNLQEMSEQLFTA
jgi:hypothetical protein